MAIINGRTPPPDLRFADAPRRVVVKLRVEPPPDAAITPSRLAAPLGSAWTSLQDRYPALTMRPYFEEAWSAAAARATRTPDEAEDLRYMAVDVPGGADPADVAATLNASDAVELAYAESGPTPPPVNPSDDPRSSNQGYLDAAPAGIDARWAWANAAADGASVGFVDLEQGWTLDHEDLRAANIALISGINQAYHGHGTAVLGQVVAVDNTRGGIGIAPRARARVVSQLRPGGTWSTADAIRSAAAVMAPGDVLLLEAQARYPGFPDNVYFPVEVEELVFQQIRHAVARGIVVVEAGGNGSVDLDAFRDVTGRAVLNRRSGEFRDSGAILVGAASAAAPHRRLQFSNHGSRIDCYAWGEAIDTCGDGWTGTSTTAYTTGFGGTSGASPIVTGAALLLQSWRIRQGLPPYPPARLRQLLSDPRTNTPSASPAADRIGVMPNLRTIVELERAAPAPGPPAGLRIVH
jgi:hypothetical protein